MKATMNHPEVSNLAVFELSANELENVAGGGAEFIRSFTVYALIQATLTIYGFESVPDEFEEYFNHMIRNDGAVITIMYNSLPKLSGIIGLIAVQTYEHMYLTQKRDVLWETYNKFK